MMFWLAVRACKEPLLGVNILLGDSKSTPLAGTLANGVLTVSDGTVFGGVLADGSLSIAGPWEDARTAVTDGTFALQGCEM